MEEIVLDIWVKRNVLNDARLGRHNGNWRYKIRANKDVQEGVLLKRDKESALLL